MRILCTHPGKIGDLFWALPTAKSISQLAGEPIDLLLPKTLGDTPGLIELLQAQDYVARVFTSEGWVVQDTAPRSPWQPPDGVLLPMLRELGYDRDVHLGYHRWPQLPLRDEVAHAAGPYTRWGHTVADSIDKSQAWMRAVPDSGVWEMSTGDYAGNVVIGFTDEYAELKAGLIYAIAGAFPDTRFTMLVPPGGSRLWAEWVNQGHTRMIPDNLGWRKADWRETSRIVAAGALFVGCLSSQAVLATGLGKPAVFMEPNPHRHHFIFQHEGRPGVMGNDGKPTFDARALVAAVREELKRG